MSALLTVSAMTLLATGAADTTFTAAGASRMVVNTQRGNVEVRTWDRDVISVSTDAGAEALGVSRSGQTIRLTQRHDFFSKSLNIRITMPARLAIDVEGVFSSIDIAGVRSDVNAETVHGAVTLSGGSGAINLHSVQGGVRVAGTSGNLRLYSTNGTIEVDGHDGPLTAETVNGAITMKRIASRSVEVTAVNGAVHYDGTVAMDGRYVLRSHNGGIVLYLPRAVSATVSVATFSGGFESDFPVTLREVLGGGRNFQFTLGDGAARIELESFAGQIRLRQGSND